MLEGGKFGITVSADGAWQKRSLGKHTMNSTTGHNFAVGGHSNKIVGMQCYSQHCRVCEYAEKKGEEPKEHRCARNYDINLSAKSMKAFGTVQHCIDLFNSSANIYMAGLVTDDDATTRANVQHSYHDICERNHPGSMVDGKIPSKMKRRLGWPLDKNGKVVSKNPGKLPIHVPPPKLFWSDPSHCVRSIGTAFYECKSTSTSDKKKDDGLTKHECNNAIRNIGYFIKRNKSMSPEEFNGKAKCVLLHLFNDHSACDVQWCTHLKAKEEPDPEKKKGIDNQRKYRKTDTKEEKKLFEKVKGKVLYLLSEEKMHEVHHPFRTQKNETLQRQAASVAPKDRYYGGRTQLIDRLRLVTVLDSVGEYEGFGRLYHSMGLPPLHTVMGLWASNKDRQDYNRCLYKRKPAVKRKRAEKKIQLMKAGMLKEKMAVRTGVTYQTGIANVVAAPVAAPTIHDNAEDALEELTETDFDTFDSIDTS